MTAACMSDRAMIVASRFDLVIFDWAGTVVDFGCRAPVEALRQAFARRGVDLSEAQIRRDMGRAKSDHVQALLNDKNVTAAWCAACGAPPTAANFHELVEDLEPLMAEQAALAATLIEGARATVDELRSAGVRIGSSTGYTRTMMQPVLKLAVQQGYAPDHLVCAGETPQGRPSPLMIIKACADLGVWPPSRVVKVDDSVAGIIEGRAAGCFTIGVAASGNGIGLSAESLDALERTDRASRIAASAAALYAAGANMVIDTVADLLPALAGIAASTAQSPILLTPGPLTTSAETKQAMQRDFGSWDDAFIAVTAAVCRSIVAIANAQGTHVCVPLQGSGTFAVEAALGTLVPRNGKVLVADNGAYCKRMVKILTCLGRDTVVLEHHEREPADPGRIDAALKRDAFITHVAQVHCETGTGILNPLAQIAAVAAAHGRSLIVDAMSSFGAIPIDAEELPFDALITASGKCLEGVPGMGLIVARRAALEKCVGNSASLAMDLFDQWRYLENTGQWRFTPPTHVLAALQSALDQFFRAGGVQARFARYTRNCAALISGMRTLGLKTFLPDALQSPIIATFHAPADLAYDFKDFYRRVRTRGFLLYPGKLTTQETFRVGCIGAIDEHTMKRAVAAVGEALSEISHAAG